MVGSSWDSTKTLIRTQVFRIWTACAVLGLYVYGWVYAPGILIWWKRGTTEWVEAACGLLPYPWNDRVEATLGNFGVWVQITLAIVLFRALIWALMVAVRRVFAGAGRGRPSVLAEGRPAPR